MGKGTRRRFACHVERVKKRLEERPLGFEAALSADLVREALAEANVSYRERIYSPHVTLWAFMGQILEKDRTCEKAVMRVQKWRMAQGLQPPSPETSHYCEARKRLPIAFLRVLFRKQYEAAVSEKPRQWRWLGKHDVKVVDGTTFLLPDTKQNRQAFPPDGESQPGTRYPIIRAVVLFELAMGLIQDFAYGPYQGKGTGESSLFRKLLENIQPGDVLLGDKYYCSYRDVHEVLRRGGHVVVRHFEARTNLTLVKRLGQGDALYWWHRPKWAHQSMSREEYERLPEKMLVRILKVQVPIPGFRVQEYEVLTTLLDAKEYPKEAFGELYFLRWRAELYLDDIKTTLGMDMLSCRSPAMIERELIVGLLAYNTVRIQMAQAAECLEVPLDQISFSTTVRVLQNFDQRKLDPDTIAVKLATIVHRRVGTRPGRSEPRAVKRKAKSYPSLKTPRPTFANCDT